MVIREVFKKKYIIILKEVELVVLKGVVICGYEFEKILSWVCRYIYGVEVVIKFDSIIYFKFKKVFKNSFEYCGDIFSIYVCVG